MPTEPTRGHELPPRNHQASQLSLSCILIASEHFYSQNKCCARRTRKHSRQRQTCREIHAPSRRTPVTYFVPQLFTRSQQDHKDWTNARGTAQREENPQVSVAAEHINYLCGHSSGESSRSEARPTKAVYKGRKVRGHGSKHVAGARLLGLRARHQGREWSDLFLQSHLVSHISESKRYPCIKTFVLHTRGAAWTDKRQNTPWLWPHGGP